MRVPFNDLPQPVRERFIRCATAKPPHAILSSTHGYATWAPPFFGVIALVGVIGCLNFLIGEANYKAPYYDREIYLLLAGCLFVFFALAATFVYSILWKPPPYRRGSYLFPSYLVHVRGEELDIVPFNLIEQPTVTHRYRNGVYMGSTLDLGANDQRGRVTATFTFNSKDAAKQAAETYFATRERMGRVLAARDAAALQQIDPFYECTLSGQWAEPPGTPKTEPLVARRPPAASWARWIGAPVLGAGIAGLFYITMVFVCANSARAQQSCKQYRSSGACCY
jgi:hypothetical protein